MSTLTPPTPAQSKRLADALDESWRVIALHDPEFAAVQKHYAGEIRKAASAASLQAPPSAPSKSYRELPKHTGEFEDECEATARHWMQNRVTSWPTGQAPPTIDDDWRDAKKQIPGVPQKFIRAARWSGWEHGKGRRPTKSVKNESVTD